MRRRRSKGYTLIEVMMAVAVMTVGVVGILGLQNAALHANVEARQIAVGNQITRIWMERLKRDAYRWNTRDVTASGVVTTQYLQTIPADWFRPGFGTASPDSYAFDWQGNDTNVVTDIYYCTHVRLLWVNPGDSARAEVRTFWDRRGTGRDTAVGVGQLFTDCAPEAGVTAELAAVPSRLHSVTAGMLLRWTQFQ